MGRDLDEVHRSILYLLQRDARNTTVQDIADTAGVSPSTVRNRIDQLEADGSIKGYHPEIDYGAANLPLQVTFVISAPPTDLPEQLYSVLDPDALDSLFAGRANAEGAVMFSYCDYDVTVTGGGDVILEC